jgi:hypothetical protein
MDGSRKVAEAFNIFFPTLKKDITETGKLA